MNCAGINAHFIDIEADDKILEVDIIHLLETSLDENEVNQLRLQGYSKQCWKWQWNNNILQR